MSIKTETDVKELEQVWLDAMAVGWVSDNKSERVSEYPHARLFRYKSPDGRFMAEDRWLSIPGSDASSGETYLYLDGVPVWVMQYYGRYTKDAIPVLKEALAINYSRERVFRGGRGPKKHECGGVSYFNYPNPESSFEQFSGREDIMNVSTGLKLGFHLYQGGMLT